MKKNVRLDKQQEEWKNITEQKTRRKSAISSFSSEIKDGLNEFLTKTVYSVADFCEL
jgi:hypothetical protein